MPVADIAAAGSGDWWYQTFATRDPGPALGLVARARELGGTAIVLGAAVAGAVARRVPRLILMITTSLLASLCTLALGAAQSFVVVFAVQCVAAFCGVLFSVVARSYRTVDHTSGVRRPDHVGVPPAQPWLCPAGRARGRRPGHSGEPRLGNRGRRSFMLAGTVGAALLMRRGR
jgi:hypothetical protein